MTLWRFPAALLLLVLSLQGGFILLSRSRAQRLSPGVDYVQGELVVTFAEDFVPSEHQVSLARRIFGTPSLDNLLSVRECYDVYKFLSTCGRAKSEGGKRLERTFLLRFRDGTDAQMLQTALLRLPAFERVSLNRLLEREYGAIKQRFPIPESIKESLREQRPALDPVRLLHGIRVCLRSVLSTTPRRPGSLPRTTIPARGVCP